MIAQAPAAQGEGVEASPAAEVDPAQEK